MSQLHTIDAYVVESIKREQVPGDIPSCPLSKKARTLIMQQCPVIVSTPDVLEPSLPFTEPADLTGTPLEDFTLLQPSTVHQRSFELSGTDTNKIWYDEFGNEYGAITLKGNNFSNPGVMRHPTAIDEYIAWGLQESKIIERVLRASEVMRSRSIGTEYIIGLSEPKQYPWPTMGPDASAHEMVSLDEYRTRIVEDFWHSLPEADQTLEKLAEITAKFREMTFFVSMRATDTAYRLGDVQFGPTDTKAARAKVYAHINNEYPLEDGDPLDPNSIEDWSRYLEKHLALQVAQNLAQLHVDLAHGFMHHYNITALGSIVDTDSVHGESLGLGDKPITAQDRAADVMQTAAQLCLSVPVDKNRTKRFNLLNAFLDEYILCTLMAYKDESEARKILSEIMLELPNFQQDERLEFGMRHSIARSYQMAFLKRFISHNGVTASRFRQFGLLFSESIAPFAQENRQSLFNSLQSRIGEVAENIIQEYTLNGNDSVEPIDSIISMMITEGHRSDTRLEIEQMLVEKIRTELVTKWTELLFEILPDVADKLGDIEFALMYQAHAEQYQQIFRDQASLLVDDFISYYCDELESLASSERAESLFPDYQSLPNLGPREGFLWQSTGDVLLGDIIDVLLTDINKFKIIGLSDAEVGKPITLVIKNGDELQQLVTDGMLDMSSFAPDKPEIEVVIEAGELGQPAYVLIITKDATGALNAQVYVPKALVDGTLHSFGIVPRTPKAKEPLHPTLF